MEREDNILRMRKKYLPVESEYHFFALLCFIGYICQLYYEVVFRYGMKVQFSSSEHFSW
jgi:hypothetical protein